MAEEKIDLNAASAEALDQLPGIGPVLAQRIVEHRQTFGPYEGSEDLTSVAGLGENSVRRLADYLVAHGSDEAASGNEEDPSELAMDAPGPDAVPEEDSATGAPEPPDTEDQPQAQEPPEIEAVPPGESLSEGGLGVSPQESAEVVEEEASEEGYSPEVEPEPQGIPTGTSFSEGGLPEEKPGAVESAQVAPVGAAQSTPEDEYRAGEGEGADLPSPTVGSPAEMKPTPPWWRQLSWVWTAILGGLLGMAFALIVFAGINGSLDVGHSQAVLDIESDLRGVTRDLQSLHTDVEDLRTRLDALEDLGERMDNVESAVDDLMGQTDDLEDRADVLEADVAGLSDQLRAVSEDVSDLQDQAERTRSFFVGLQTLLQDIFGEIEGAPMAAPTPTPEGK